MSLKQIAQIFTSALPAREFFSRRSPGSVVQLRQFIGSAASLALTEASRHQRPLVVITPDPDQARLITSDMEALGVGEIHYFPPGGRVPYHTGKLQDTTVMAQRSDVVDRIRESKDMVVVTSATALFEKMAPAASFAGASITLSTGNEMDPDELAARLADQQYQAVSFVNEPGEYARRGGILDIFPFSGSYPVRLEFFGNEIESIREFDPDSQRSVAFLDQIRLVPNLEALPCDERESLLSLMGSQASLAIMDYPGVIAALQERYHEAESHYMENPARTTTPASSSHSEASASPETVFHTSVPSDSGAPEMPPPALAPSSLYLSPAKFEEQFRHHPCTFFGALPPGVKPDLEFRLQARPQPDFNSSVKLLRSHLENLSAQAIETWILCDNEGQRQRFEELLGESGPRRRYRIIVETLHRGFELPDEGVALYTDHQIFNRYYRPRTRMPVRRGGISFKQLKDLNIGDYVVHVDHGIGKFAGFRKITVRGSEQESVVIRYQNDSILYVNVSSLHKLQKYSGRDGTAPKITRLGSGEWARKKARTRKRVKDIARDLIALYARRKSQKAHAFSPDCAMQTELEASFMYEETPDQAQAIRDVKSDMTKETPMDRLVCGDVGFGKTEVAVRAAFKAVLDGKQVAVMVPTTILADQHWKTFRDRMKQFAVTIEVLSRFRSKAQQTEILKRTKKGEVDILIGTHRIASKDVAFRDLGLMIVDEEQRFGVSMKERLKELRASVDVLTLTATPIPRTLQFSLMGARDLSVIHTPPPNRQPVLTEIHPFDSRLIRDAIVQEVSRGGQVFFIHNRVQDIEKITDRVRSLVPNIRVQFAHGQMPGSRLEKIILDFYDHKFDVLVSTNIVENGIDIANANTIIIHHANYFGLAELHQLRGRVGRSNRKAYCYLITPPMESLTLESRRRLLALEEYSDLGSGFHIAMRDLDIRGAGDILGAEQSGFISDIGFEMYTRIMNDAIRELKETEFAGLFTDTVSLPDRPETTVDFDESALLPAWYVADNVERLNLYRRLSGTETEEEITQWQDEVTDRFGALPDAAANLITATRIKVLASRLWLDKVTVRAGRMWLQCPDHATNAGSRFYDQGGMQHLIDRLEAYRGDQFQLVQKNQAIRFAIRDVDGLTGAVELLRKLQWNGVSSNHSANNQQTKISQAQRTSQK